MSCPGPKRLVSTIFRPARMVLLSAARRAGAAASKENRDSWAGEHYLYGCLVPSLLPSFLSLFPTWLRCIHAHSVCTAPNGIKRLGCIPAGCSCAIIMKVCKKKSKITQQFKNIAFEAKNISSPKNIQFIFIVIPGRLRYFVNAASPLPLSLLSPIPLLPPADPRDNFP